MKEFYNSLTFRILIWGLTSILSLGSYSSYDIPGALGPDMHHHFGHHFGPEKTTGLYSAYSWGNLFFLFFSGMLIDRLGTSKSSLLFSTVVVIGQAVVSISVPIYVPMIVGRVVFGIGAESLNVAGSAILSKWFEGKELAFAFGAQLTVSRLGTLLTFGFAAACVPLVGIQGVFWLGTLLCLVSLAANVGLWALERAASPHVSLREPEAHDPMRFADVKDLSMEFWLTIGICTLFYSVALPFVGLLPLFLHDELHINSVEAGRLAALPTLCAMFLAPVLGWAVDRIGRRTEIILAGTGIVVVALALIVSFPKHDFVAFPIFLIGLGYSLAPAALWPAIPLIVDGKVVGTAFAICTLLQNLGLAATPLVLGQLYLNSGHFFDGNAFLLGLAITAFVLALLLHIRDSRGSGVLKLTAAQLGEEKEKTPLL